MVNYYYSRTTNGFYNSEINISMPSDAVEISQDTWLSLLADQAAGEQITSNDSGNPIAIDIVLTPAQNGKNALNAGIVISSTGTPAINGTYPCYSATQAKVNGIITCILVNGTFPNGATTQNWFDIEKNLHVFPDVLTFKNFANGFINFVTLVDEYINCNGESGSIPSNQITIP